jgi:L-ascorbate metabolism protein UlaG (beta-lactamase superfamily)
MKITKLGHSCLLVETPERVTLFDPGVYSKVDTDSLQKLDDIIITHIHPDHLDTDLVKQLAAKFGDVHITTTDEIVAQLNAESVPATSAVSEGITLFTAPHEGHAPFLAPPQNIGVHYLERLSHPGDSHSFTETKAILALPVQAPWGSTLRAVDLALELKPTYIVPIHDWHWRDEAREGLYGSLEKLFAAQGITFVKAANGESFELEV